MATKIELDFDSIKNNIKTYLQSQSEFSDYDFDGSGLTVLIDALAYNSHYQALTANMAMSEAFLDSAQIRKNVVARVKDINYFPRQISAAIAEVQLDVSATTGQTITVSKGTRFTSEVNSFTYTFVTTDDINMVEDGISGNYSVSIVISQGVFRTQTFISSGDSSQRYILTQKDVDASEQYFTVDIRLTAQATKTENHTRSNSISDIKGDSTIYYIQEAENGNVEIYFGDGILGRAVVVNEAIDVNYLVTKGIEANDATVFSLIDPVGAGSISSSNFTVTTLFKAAGGAPQEGIESIKFNGPLVNTTQDRAITVDDYRALLLNKYPAISSLNVWGGEDNIPPQYGAVFIAVKPNYGLTISPATKLDISNTILNKYSAIGIKPEIVDAEYTYINVTSLITFDDDKTTLKIGELTTKIIAGVETYFDNSVSAFTTDFRFSKLTSYIDGISESISGNVTTITLSKKLTPVSGAITTADLHYNSEVDKGTIQSNVWTDPDTVTTWEIRDDSLGKIYFYKDGIINGTSIGQVDYENGVVNITSAIFYTQASSQEITIIAVPTITDIKMETNNILLLGVKDIKVQKLI